MSYYCRLFSTVFIIITAILCNVQCSVHKHESSLPCNSSSGNYIIKLDGNITLNKEFCIISNANITITTNSSNDTAADIYCNGGSNQSLPVATGGITFINSIVTIERINLINCGEYLKSLPDNITNIINSSFFYYPDSYAAALLFVNSSVNISTVSMNSSFGFAVIGFNLNNSTFVNSIFSSDAPFEIGIRQNQTIGSGFLIHYTDPPSPDTNNTNYSSKHVVINGCHFVNNYMYIHNNTRNHCEQKLPILNSAALTVMYTQTVYQAHVSIQKVCFTRNAGMFAATLLIVHYNNLTTHEKMFKATTHILNCTFNKFFTFYNVKYPETSEIRFIMNATHSVHTEPILLIEDTSFIDKSDKGLLKTNFQSRVIYINIIKSYRVVTIKLKQVSFKNIVGNITGVCMYVQSKFRSKVNIHLESIEATNNKITTLFPVPLSSGIFTFTGVTCIVNGTRDDPSNFTGNFGSVIDATNTNLKLHGCILFKNNMAINGPAINIKLNSRLFFMTHSSISFQDNKASHLGGAINAVVSTIYNHCVFHFLNMDPSFNNIKFINNSAQDGGDSIYASPIFNCKLSKNYITNADRNTLKIYKSLFCFHPNDSKLLQLSTTPVSVSYNNKETIIYTYPGEQSSVCLSAKDSADRNVFASVTVYISPLINDFESNNVWLSYKGKMQGIQEKNTCTNLSVLIHSSRNSSTSRTLIFFLSDKAQIYKTLIVNIRRCPIGFSLKADRSICDCSKALDRFSTTKDVNLNCNINTKTFRRPITSYSYSWAGRLPNNTFGITTNDVFGIFAISSNCPVGHCTTNNSLAYFYSNDSTVSLKSSPELIAQPICTQGREGILCGKCKKGYYLTMSSPYCRKDCKTYFSYWVVIGSVAIAGPFTVLLLYALKMTLSVGTIGGIIFYIDVVSISLIDLLFSKSKCHILSTFEMISINYLSLINLRIGIPVCFYQEMDELNKTGLVLVFPFYLLTIVCAIIIISRYSTWLSNKTSRSSVQVLVTVVHLSICTLCYSIVKTFSSTNLYTDEKVIKVWQHDGSIEFLKNTRHLILTIVTLVAVLPLVTVYVVFLLFTKHFLKCSRKLNLNFRQIYEAIHAPYKEGNEYWFVTRLLLLIFICLLPLIILSTKIIYMVTALFIFLFLIGHVLFHPYKNKVLNMLDNWILFNLAAVYGGVLIWQDKPNNAIILLVLSTMSMLCTTIGIIFYHILMVTGALDKMTKYLSTKRNPHHEMLALLNTLSFFNSIKAKGQQQQQQQQRDSAMLADSFYGSCTQYREPILGEEN